MKTGADSGSEKTWSDYGLPAHVEESIDTLAKFHLQHRKQRSTRQRAIDLLTASLARPATVILVALGIAAIIAVALLAGLDVADPVFAWLELAATLGALLVALIILATQSREDELMERREQLTLQLALAADRKTAKLIALVEELRKDAPDMANRVDQVSEEMAAPVDADAVLSALERAPDA